MNHEVSVADEQSTSARDERKRVSEALEYFRRFFKTEPSLTEHDREDLTSRSLEALLVRTRSAASPIENLRAYATEIARNKLNDFRREQQRERHGKAELHAREQAATDLRRAERASNAVEEPEDGRALRPGRELDAAVEATAIELLTNALRRHEWPLDTSESRRRFGAPPWTDADTAKLRKLRGQYDENCRRSSMALPRALQIASALRRAIQDAARLIDEPREPDDNAGGARTFIEETIRHLEPFWEGGRERLKKLIVDEGPDAEYTFRFYVTEQINYPGEPLRLPRFPSQTELAAMAFLAGDRVQLDESKPVAPRDVLSTLGKGIALGLLALEDPDAPGFALIGAWSKTWEGCDDEMRRRAPRPKLRPISRRQKT